MALRKMLGSADHPEIIRMMQLIETQSKATLTCFSADYAEAHYLPITDALIPEERRLRDALAAVRAHMDGAPLSAVKAAVKEARAAAQALTKSPVAQAAAVPSPQPAAWPSPRPTPWASPSTALPPSLTTPPEPRPTAPSTTALPIRSWPVSARRWRPPAFRTNPIR